MPADMPFEQLVRPFGETSRGITFHDRRSHHYVSWDELARIAAATVRRLCADGAGQDRSVGIVLQNNLESVATLLGLWMAGSTVVSLPPAPRGAAAQAYGRHYAELLASMGCELVYAGRRTQEAFDGRLTARPYGPTEPQATLRDADAARPGAHTALVQFSSGSTSRPKGVPLSREILAGHLGVMAEALRVDSETDGFASWLPLYHDMGLMGLLMGPLITRADLALTTPLEFVRNPLSWLALCSESGATITAAPTFAYRTCSRLAARRSLPADLSRVRLWLCGAERVSWQTLRDFTDALAGAGARWQAMAPVYGMAEATLAVTFPPLDRAPVRGPLDTASVGSPLAGVSLDLLPPHGERSAIRIRSRWMPGHYVTAGGRIPLTDEQGWLETNDLGQARDGELYVFGRSDEVVISRGRNICAEDVEQVAIVVLRDRAERVAAFRSTENEAAFGLAVELPRHVGVDRLDDGVRAAVGEALGVQVAELVLCEPHGLPVTTSGKPMRRRCADQLADGELAVLKRL